MVALCKLFLDITYPWASLLLWFLTDSFETARFRAVKHKASRTCVFYALVLYKNAFPIYRFSSHNLYPWASAMFRKRCKNTQFSLFFCCFMWNLTFFMAYSSFSVSIQSLQFVMQKWCNRRFAILRGGMIIVSPKMKCVCHGVCSKMTSCSQGQADCMGWVPCCCSEASWWIILPYRIWFVALHLKIAPKGAWEKRSEPLCQGWGRGDACSFRFYGHGFRAVSRRLGRACLSLPLRRGGAIQCDSNWAWTISSCR